MKKKDFTKKQERYSADPVMAGSGRKDQTLQLIIKHLK